MSELTLTSNDSKLLYACLRQAYFILTKAQSFKQFCLGELFPQIDTKWNDIKPILELGISRKVAWTGMSMTKSDNVPDDTRVPPSAEINSNTIRIMYAKAQAAGVTLSENYEFFDESANFVEAGATWLQAINAYLEIINMSQEIGLFKMAAGEMEGSVADLSRSPAQLIMFDQVEVPLANGSRWGATFNGEGIKAGFGSFYEDFFFKSVDNLLAGSLQNLDVLWADDEIYGTVDPDDSNKTRYYFEMPNDYSLIGAIQGLASDGSYLTTTIYTSDIEGYFSVPLAIASAPPRVSVKMFGIQMT